MIAQFVHLIVIAASALLTTFLANKARKKIRPDHTGLFRLRINKISLYVGFTCAAFGMACLIAAWPEGWFHQKQLSSTVLLLAFPAVIGCILLLHYFNYRVQFDEAGVDVRNAWRRTIFIPWKQIERARYHAWSGWLILQDGLGQKAKVDISLPGFDLFLHYLERHTSWTARELHLPED